MVLLLRDFVFFSNLSKTNLSPKKKNFYSFFQLSKLSKEAAFFCKVKSGNIKDADFTLQDQSKAKVAHRCWAHGVRCTMERFAVQRNALVKM